jgi:hypothetical protein
MSIAPSLTDLYARYDTVRSQLEELPEETRRAYWNDGRPAGQMDDLIGQLRTLSDLIADHPDFRDFEADLKDAFGEQLRDTVLAGRLYAAMCNVTWTHEQGTRFSCSWRAAGDLVAELRNDLNDTDEIYLDWYCGGDEGTVHPDIAAVMTAAGWAARPA